MFHWCASLIPSPFSFTINVWQIQEKKSGWSEGQSNVEKEKSFVHYYTLGRHFNFSSRETKSLSLFCRGNFPHLVGDQLFWTEMRRLLSPKPEASPLSLWCGGFFGIVIEHGHCSPGFPLFLSILTSHQKYEWVVERAYSLNNFNSQYLSAPDFFTFFSAHSAFIVWVVGAIWILMHAVVEHFDLMDLADDQALWVLLTWAQYEK